MLESKAFHEVQKNLKKIFIKFSLLKFELHFQLVILYIQYLYDEVTLFWFYDLYAPLSSAVPPRTRGIYAHSWMSISSHFSPKTPSNLYQLFE